MIRPWKGCSPLPLSFAQPVGLPIHLASWDAKTGETYTTNERDHAWGSNLITTILQVFQASSYSLYPRVPNWCWIGKLHKIALAREFCLALGCFVALLYLILSTLCRSDTSLCELRVIPNVYTRDVSNWIISSINLRISSICDCGNLIGLIFHNWEINKAPKHWSSNWDINSTMALWIGT